MTASGSKVITTLRERWQIDQDIQEMLRVRSQQEFTDRAQQLAARGDHVISVILRRLDRADGRMLSVLGTISSLYPQREQILNSLYEAAADLDRPDRGRVSAMLILERFLGQEPDPYLISTLDDPQFMALESIREMIREGERDPRMLIEYARSLAEQPEETIEGVIETLIEVGAERAVPVLCLLAQDDRDVLGEAALLALGRLYHPEAGHGLQSILPLLPPERRSLCERSLLKLRLKQVPVHPRPPVNEAWRALVSPIDGEGSQIVWFIGKPDEQGLCRFVGFSINDLEGIRQVYGHVDVPSEALPERRLRGHVHNVALPMGPPGEDERPSRSRGMLLLMLEADFDYGRRLVQEGQACGARQGHPLPVEYRLFGPWLWQYDDAQVASSRWLDTRPAGMAGHVGSAPLAETARLLSHPAFRGWFAHGDSVLQHATSLLRRTPLIVGSNAGEDLAALARTYFDRAMIERLQARLAGNSEWLWRAGDVQAAGAAARVAETLRTTSPAEHPFARGMVELGLRAAIEQLRRM